MFGLSLGHILVLLVVVLLFGSRRLPELGGALGKAMRAFKKGLEEGDEPKIEDRLKSDSFRKDEDKK